MAAIFFCSFETKTITDSFDNKKITANEGRNFVFIVCQLPAGRLFREKRLNLAIGKQRENIKLS